MFAHAKGNFENSKWIIVGIPTDVGSLSEIKDYLRSPDVIREASYRIFSPLFGEIDMNEICDYGNIEDLEYIKDIDRVYNYIRNEIKKIYKKDKKYIFLGGDHSITYPIIDVISKNWDNFFIILFDSHPDMHPDPFVNYQSFLFYLIREEKIDPSNIMIVGLSNLSFEEKELLKNFNIKYFSSFDIWRNLKDIVEIIKKEIDSKNIYISIDLDVFDSGCGHWAEPFGIKLYHYFEIINNIDENIVGLDLVELYPTEFCENFAAKLLIETIAIFNNNLKFLQRK